MPNPPPEIPSVEPFQLQSVTRGIIAETEERIVHLEEMDRRSLEVRQTILRRLEEYRRFVFYQNLSWPPFVGFPQNSYQKYLRFTSQTTSKPPLACYVDNGV